jgi:murein DD-endopeptidase MepM/ murein hydrolase activator NlpD
MHNTGPEIVDEEAGAVSVASAIVPQGDARAQRLMAWLRSPSATVCVTILGVAVAALIWNWPQLRGAGRSSAAQVAAAQPVGAAALLITARMGNQVLAAEPAPLAQGVLLTPTTIVLPTPTATAELPDNRLAMSSAQDRAGLAATVAPAQPDTVVLLDPLPTKVAVVLVPTETPIAPATSEAAVAVSALPQVRILPAVGIKLPPTRTPVGNAVIVGPTPTPTPEPLPIEPGRLWSDFVPVPENNHFWIGRPFLPSVGNQLSATSYQFGSTAGNRYRPHHGVDISNPMGTPVLAATEGEVVHAGLDDPDVLGPYPNFYGNAVVIRLDRRLTVGDGALDVYLLYGHLSQVFVTVGQRVKPDDVVGAVGMTGIAIGPHLHVEMRLGANTYRHSVNPYLWLQPLGDNGAVAVRLLTADGRTWPGARLTLARFEGGQATWARLIETYLDTENIGPDPTWGENGAMEGVPPGFYVLVGVVNGESVRTELTVNAGQTSFVEIRTKQ